MLHLVLLQVLIPILAPAFHQLDFLVVLQALSNGLIESAQRLAIHRHVELVSSGALPGGANQLVAQGLGDGRNNSLAALAVVVLGGAGIEGFELLGHRLHAGQVGRGDFDGQQVLVLAHHFHRVLRAGEAGEQPGIAVVALGVAANDRLTDYEMRGWLAPDSLLCHSERVNWLSAVVYMASKPVYSPFSSFCS